MQEKTRWCECLVIINEKHLSLVRNATISDKALRVPSKVRWHRALLRPYVLLGFLFRKRDFNDN